MAFTAAVSVPAAVTQLHRLSSSTTRVLRVSAAAMAVATKTAVQPAVVVGGGRVGQALLATGPPGADVLVGRGEKVPEDKPGPILVCTRNDDLDAVLEATPRLRWRGTPWTEEEHRMFLMDLQKLGKGDWCGISRNFVVSRTPTQVASHAQKYFIRQTNSSTQKRRSSLFDMVPEMPMDESPVVAEQLMLHSNQDEATSSNQLPISHLVKQKEPEFARHLSDLQLRKHEEPEFTEPSLAALDLEMNHTVPFKAKPVLTMPAFYPALIPVPLTLWPPNVANVDEAGTAHEILKPTPMNGKEVINKADDVVGMSKLSIGEGSSDSIEPSALSLQLNGSTNTRHSAFHVNPPMAGPDLNKRNNSPIHAV